jgi:hypothetical protein
MNLCSVDTDTSGQFPGADRSRPRANRTSEPADGYDTVDSVSVESWLRSPSKNSGPTSADLSRELVVGLVRRQFVIVFVLNGEIGTGKR